MASNWRITVTLPEQFKEFLELWAQNEHRSVSNLAASILINAAQDKISTSELEIQKPKTIKKSTPKPKSTKPAKPKPTT
jgi:hypothetical protein